MTSDSSALAEQFGLTRENFILDPVTDFICFAREDINTQDIAGSLDIDVVTGLAPKRLVWGAYGAGKTHTLMRTVDELSKLTPIKYVRIECPVLAKKSRFHDLYREGIMRALGQNFTINLMEAAIDKVGYVKDPGLRRDKLKHWFKDEEMATVAERIYVPNFDRLKLWRWLSGVPMSRSDLDELDQTQDLSQAEPARLADIVIILGRLVKLIHEKTLVLILDEMERLDAIGPESITTFMSGFTRLVDPSQKWVSILIGNSAHVEGQLVEIFSKNSPVGSRLGEDARIEIDSLQATAVDRYIEGVVAYVRDPNFDAPTKIKSLGDCPEALSDALFPFTVEAVEALKSKTQTLTPRAISIQMTRALGRAHRKGLSYVSSDCVE